MEVNERIAEIMAHYDLSVKEFATKIGAKTQQAVYDLLHGKTKSISTDMENKIISCFPEISRAWLLTGEGEKFVEPQPKPQSKTSDTILVPVASPDSIGGTRFNEEVNTEEYINGYLPFPTSIAHQGDVVIPIYGDSMEPTYKAGSMVLIREVELWREYLELGCTYVIGLVDDRRIIKTVMAGSDAKHLLLVSINPAYEPQEIDKKIIRSVWRVIVSVRRETL
jgi:SOS-response transcriptional repressor LexA